VQELVVALQWMVLHFENSFVTLAIAEENSRKDLIVETLSPFSGMRRISSRDRLKMLSPSNTYTVDAIDGFTQDRIKRVSSSSSISSLGKITRCYQFEKNRKSINTLNRYSGFFRVPGNNWEFVRKPCESLGNNDWKFHCMFVANLLFLCDFHWYDIMLNFAQALYDSHIFFLKIRLA